MVSGKWRGLVHTPAGRAAAPPSGIKLVSLGMDWWVTTRRWGCGVGLYGGERVCFFVFFFGSSLVGRLVLSSSHSSVHLFVSSEHTDDHCVDLCFYCWILLCFNIERKCCIPVGTGLKLEKNNNILLLLYHNPWSTSCIGLDSNSIINVTLFSLSKVKCMFTFPSVQCSWLIKLWLFNLKKHSIEIHFQNWH